MAWVKVSDQFWCLIFVTDAVLLSCSRKNPCRRSLALPAREHLTAVTHYPISYQLELWYVRVCRSCNFHSCFSAHVAGGDCTEAQVQTLPAAQQWGGTISSPQEIWISSQGAIKAWKAKECISIWKECWLSCGDAASRCAYWVCALLGEWLFQTVVWPTWLDFKHCHFQCVHYLVFCKPQHTYETQDFGNYVDRSFLKWKSLLD